MKTPTVYLAACDNYLHALRATHYLFQQFWPDAQVVVLGYKKPTFEFSENWSFISMGSDPGVQQWSNGIIDYFNSIDDTHIIFGVEDHPPIKPVRTNIIDKLLHLMDDPKVGKITLTEDLTNRAYEFHSINEGTQIIKTAQNADYRLSTQYAIWQKDYFLKYLRRNIDPWDFEVNGSVRAKNDGYDIVGTCGQIGQDYAIHSCEAIRKGKYDQPMQFFNLSCRPHHMELDEVYIKEMQEKGII